MDGTKSIPRMRTAAKIVAEIRALDPDTEVTEFHIRKLAKSGAVPVVWAGRKALINLDDVLDLMRLGTARPTEEAAPAVGVIRHQYPPLKGYQSTPQKGPNLATKYTRSTEGSHLVK